jgi:hypothetical protein
LDSLFFDGSSHEFLWKSRLPIINIKFLPFDSNEFLSKSGELTGRYQLIQIAVVGGPSKKLLYDIMHLLY